MTILIILIAVAVIVFFAYNSLAGLRVRADGAWADIDVQLKRRHDLVPNLVETVKGYASHESGTLEKVIQARSQAMSAQGPAQQAAAENVLSGALKSLFALSESYPQLRATENFTQLQNQLSAIENDIQGARRYYNAVVRDYNMKVAQAPSNMVARMFNFHEREYFEIDEEERAVPKVSF